MNNRLKYIGIFFIIALFGIAYIGPQQIISIATSAQSKILKGKSPVNAEGLNPEVLYDWMYYGNVEEICDRSDAIIKGEVVKVYDPQIMITSYVDNSNEVYKDVYTISDVKIVESIKGSLNPGDVIKVRQMGGSYKGVNYKKYDYEFFKENTQGIMFLCLFDGYAELVNPGQGMVKLVNSKTSIPDDFSLKENHVSVSGGDDTYGKLFKNNLDENELIKQIKEALR